MDTINVKRTLPGIKSISLARQASVTLEKSWTEENKYVATGDFEKLPLAGLCSFTVSPEVVKGQLIYSYQVDGLLFDQSDTTVWDWNAIPIYAKVTDIYGSCYLIGNKDKPYATCLIGLTTEESSTGKRCRPLTISFKSPSPLSFCH